MKRLALSFCVFCLLPLVAIAEEGDFPAAGSLGLNFTINGSNFGSLVYPDPLSSKLDTITGSGIGLTWWSYNDWLRLRGIFSYQYASYGYSNADNFDLNVLGLDLEADISIVRADRILVYAGPFTQIGYLFGSYYTDSSGASTAISGVNLTAGGVLGAEYFFSRHFSFGAWCPISVRFVWTDTGIDVQSKPSEFNFVGFNGFYGVLSFYF
jgi:hypothetical protein